jgi:hypothetical protein
MKETPTAFPAPAVLAQEVAPTAASPSVPVAVETTVSEPAPAQEKDATLNSSFFQKGKRNDLSEFL